MTLRRRKLRAIKRRRKLDALIYALNLQIGYENEKDDLKKLYARKNRQVVPFVRNKTKGDR